MAIREVFIDNATGSATPTDPTLISDPYDLILNAEVGERGDLVSATTTLIMTLLDGTWNENTAIVFSSANWTTDGTNDITIRPQTAFGTTINTTSNTYADIITVSGDLDFTIQDFLMDHQGATGTPSHGCIASTGSDAVVIQRMILRGPSNVVDVVGINDPGVIIKNCVIIANGTHDSSAARIGARSKWSHCTVIHLGSTGDALGVDSAVVTVVEYCYGHSAGGAGYAGTAATKTAILTSDGTGDTGSIAYSTANFTSVTVDSEDLSLVAGSALIDAASGSSETIDILGASRSTPDNGAYEFIAAASINTIIIVPTGPPLS